MTPKLFWSRVVRPGPGAGKPTISWPQVVAYNLKTGREARGLSQAELGEQLGLVTGTPWSVPLISAAEAGWAGRTGRVRAFDVEDLVAFSLALRLPLTWFLLPPPATPDGRIEPRGDGWIKVDRRTEGRCLTTDAAWFLALARADPEDTADLFARRVKTEADERWHVGGPARSEGGSKDKLWAELLHLVEKHGHES